MEDKYFVFGSCTEELKASVVHPVAQEFIRRILIQETQNMGLVDLEGKFELRLNEEAKKVLDTIEKEMIVFDFASL